MDSEEKINLSALQKNDPYIVRIVFKARHVAVYTFNKHGEEWSKTGMEGPCFIYARSARPFHGFVIINQLDVKNFVEPITSELDCQLQQPFLLYRNPTEIHGLWFYDPAECAKFVEIVNRFRDNARDNIAPQAYTGTGKTTSLPLGQTRIDIIDMLNKAQSEFSLKTEPTKIASGPTDNPPSHMVKPQAVKPIPSPANPILDPLMSPAPGQQISVNDLFKQAQSVAAPPKQSEIFSIPESAAFKRIPHEKITPLSELEGKEAQAHSKELLTPASLLGVNSSSKLDTASSPQALTPAKNLMPNKPNIELMSPMAFSSVPKSTVPMALTTTTTTATPPPVVVNPPQHINLQSSSEAVHKLSPCFPDDTKPSADTKEGFSRSLARTFSQTDPVPLDRHSPPVAALTHEQLKQALIHLINTDQQFLTSVHNAYIQSLNSSLRH